MSLSNKLEGLRDKEKRTEERKSDNKKIGNVFKHTFGMTTYSLSSSSMDAEIQSQKGDKNQTTTVRLLSTDSTNHHSNEMKSTAIS